MTETVNLLWVRPAFSMPDVSVSLSKEDLKLSETLSIEPLIVNALPESILEEFRQLQMELFCELVDNTITFDLREHRDLYVEDNILFGSLQFKERRNEFKRFADYMFLIKDSNTEEIRDRFGGLKERYETLIAKTVSNLKRYINDTVAEIIKNFPDLRVKESNFKRVLESKSAMLEDATINIEFFDLTLSEDDPIIKRCINEAYESAILVESKLINGPEKILDSQSGYSGGIAKDSEFAFLQEVTKNSKFTFLQEVAKRILKYNVHEEEDLTEVGMYYNHIFKDIDTFKNIDHQELKNKIDDFPDFGLKMLKRKISDAINA